jgi:hypothetical protein
MSDSDRTGSHTQLYVVQCAWDLTTMYYLIR